MRFRNTVNPRTGMYEPSTWERIDEVDGEEVYEVKFRDGGVYDSSKTELPSIDVVPQEKPDATA